MDEDSKKIKNWAIEFYYNSPYGPVQISKDLVDEMKGQSPTPARDFYIAVRELPEGEIK